jgi:hypothetical protein
MLGNMEDKKCHVFREEKNQSTYGDLMFDFFSVILLGRATEGRNSFATGAEGAEALKAVAVHFHQKGEMPVEDNRLAVI